MSTTTSLPRLSRAGAPASCGASIPGPVFLLLLPLLLFFAAHGSFSFLGDAADFRAIGNHADGTHRPLLVAVWIASLGCLLPSLRSLAQIARRNALIFALPALALLSAAWSQDPSSTLHNALYLALTTLFALYLATMSVADLERLLLTAGLLACLLSLLLAFVAPAYGLDRVADSGALQGIFVGKNPCAIALLFFLTPVLWKSGHHRFATAACAVLLPTCILATRSRTGIGLALLLLAARYLPPSLARLAPAERAAGVFVSAVVLISLVWFGLSHWQTLATHLGRDSTLNGRTTLWNALLPSLARRPWLGYGYTAFWLGLRGEDMNVFPRIRWLMGYAHNGYLEICLQLGLAGVAAVVALLVRAGLHARRALLVLHDPAAAWPAAILLLTCLYNLDEAFLGAYHQLPWMLFLVAAARLEMLSASPLPPAPPGPRLLPQRTPSGFLRPPPHSPKRSLPKLVWR